jgi:hypothetical protein
VSEIIDLVQKTAIRQLTQRSGETLDRLEVAAIKGVAANRDVILEAFTEGLLRSFDELLGRASEQEAAVCNFETLSLVQESELEVMVAVEGMVAAARNRHLAHFISFNTRLNSRLSDRIDESNNPMDPEQIAAAFQDAVRPLGLSSGDSLTLFRGFNGCVLKSLDEVLHACNGVLIEHGVIPDLGLDSARPTASARRRTPRSPLEDADVSSFGSVAAERFDEQQNQPELFSIMQNLMHGDASLTATPAPAVAQTDYVVPAELLQQAVSTEGPGQPVTIVDQQKLMQILSDIQNVLDTRTDGDGSESDEILPLDRELLATSLGQQLEQNAESGVTNAVDRHSSDVINLVTMLYEAIWQDESVPIPIKELIGRTQITIIKVALSDTTFFNVEDHPARALLNEFAAAGIGRNEVEDLHEDPLYVKMQQLITSILEEYDDGPDFFEKHVADFRAFRAREARKTRRLEQRILRAKERQARLEDIRELVTQKINERILGRDLQPFVADLLHHPFHKFMELLVLKEGPGGNAWRQAINTIDVLLWSVQNHDHAGDRDRLETVNPRLLNNLRKAFRIAQIENVEIDSLITGLKDLQQLTFEGADGDVVLPAMGTATASDDNAPAEPQAEPEALADDDPAMQQVEHFAVGVWVEFLGPTESEHVRCKLAAKINAIDKYIFVNRQGVKVVEKTKLGLALELKQGTVRVISDGLLFSRALESVIGSLRETQTEQHEGGAYKPGANKTPS